MPRPWLDDRLGGKTVAEVLGKGAEDQFPVGFDCRNALQILRREPAAEIDHRQVDAALGAHSRKIAEAEAKP